MERRIMTRSMSRREWLPICAALLPHVIRANLAAAREIQSTRTLDRYAEIGRALLGDPRAGADSVFAITAKLVLELNIGPLSQFGMNDSDIPAMCALARKASSMRYNPVVLSDDALANALSAAIRGEAIG